MLLWFRLIIPSFPAQVADMRSRFSALSFHGQFAYHRNTIHIVFNLIMHMKKKLLVSDWLRVMQFKCNTSAKSVTLVQITHRNSGLWFAGRWWEIFRPMISCKAMTKILYGNFEKSFLQCEKNGFKEHLPARESFTCLYYYSGTSI